MHTCELCGRTGPDVAYQASHRGGAYQCADQTACWARWDSVHGLTHTYAQQLMAERTRRPAVAR